MEDRSLFGHPRDYPRFLHRDVERFSYYGMRALLILFMTDFGSRRSWHDRRGARHGLYTFGVRAQLPGG
jgi:dipeptide/tripeptide permease